MNREIALGLFGIYSFCYNILFFCMEFLPHPLRIVIFRAALKKLGRSPLIDYKTYFRYPGKITIGHHVAINRGCQFFATVRTKNGTITIGDKVVFSPNVKIYAGGHDYGSLNLPDIAKPVVIEDHVWVGADAIILPGVVLGKGSVVGAGSVVTRSIAPFCVVAGNPAKVIKQRPAGA
jgi:acetyltransferase-like isoleucine patch superfamily enzyme